MFKSVFTAMDEGVVLRNRKAEVTAANPAAEKILGLAAAELIGQSWEVRACVARYIHADGSTFTRANHPALVTLRTGQPQRNVVMGVYRPDGALVWLSVNSQPVIARGESLPYAVATIFRDIAGSELAKFALSEIESYRPLLEKQKIIQTSLDGFLVARVADGRIFEANEAFCSMVGYSCDELLTMRLSDLEADESPEDAAAHIKKVIAVGYDRFETRHRHKQGHLINLEVSASHSKRSGGSNFVFVRDITERKQMEQAIAAREQEFRSLAESSLDSIIRHDLDGRIRYLNRGLLNYFGLSATDVIGKLAREVWPDGRYAEIDRAITLAQETGKPATVEFGGADAEGKLYFNQVHIVPERDAAGQIIGTIGYGRDVTAIREAERKLKRFIDNLPGLAYTFRSSPDGRACFPYVSPAIEEFYGLKPEDVKDDFTPIHLLAHPDDRPRIEAATAESGRTMTPFNIESRVCRPGLPVRWLDVRSSPEREADGSIVWYGIMLDITERKHMEQALAAREREYRTLAENTPDSIYRYDRDYRRLYVNQTVCRIVGKSAEELIGSTIDDGKILVSEQGRKVMDAIDRVFDSGETQSFLVDFIDQSGGHNDYHMLIVPEHDADGQVATVLGFTREVTDIRRLERRQSQYFAMAPGLFATILHRADGSYAMPFTSDGIRDLYGLEPEEVMRDIGVFVVRTHPDDVEMTFRKTGESERDLMSFNVEYRIIHPTTGVRWIECNSMPQRLPDGSTRWDGFYHDITERKQAELERDADNHFLECMDRVNRAILGSNDLEQMMSDVLDVVLSIFDCDRAFLVYPCDPEVVEFQIPMERTKPEYPGALVLGVAVPMGKEMAAMFRAVLSVAGPVKLGPGAEYPLPPFLSEQYDVKSEMLMALHPKHDKPWQFGLHQCSHPRVWSAANERLLQEIGRRLEEALTSLLMQRNLQASEQKFRSLAENMPDTLIRYDHEGRRTYINPALKRISAVRDEQMIGLMQQESNPFVMPEIYRLALEHTLATGERSELELPIPTPSGDIRTNRIFIVAERADSQILGAITIGHDITQLKQTEQQLRELAAHLETVREEEKIRLAREIHDDLGSTLAAIKLRLSHLLDFELSEEMKKTPLFARLESMSPMLESAIAATRRIITDMRPDVLDNLGLLAALKWQAEQFSEHSGIECRIVCSKDHVCADCKQCEYQLDKTLSINLFRIFQEALSNVARHSGASRVEAEYRPGNGNVLLSIRDDGCGLAEGHTPASTSFGIRGMRERVGQLGGQIKFDSPLGGGLCVTVRLPFTADNKGRAEGR